MNSYSSIIILNDNLTEVLGLNFSELNENDLSKLLSGNLLPDGSKIGRASCRERV